MESKQSNHTRIKFLGGAREVGRSAIAVSSENTVVLLDYGILVNHEPGFPMHAPPRDVRGIVLTHAHLDHTGSTPIYYVRNKIPLYGTRLTMELTKILINDLINLAGYYLPYEHVDLEKMLDCRVNIDYDGEFEVGDLKVRFMEAGHIPGSAQAVVKTKNGETIAYTGDINTEETKLLKAADTDYGDLTCLIVESTYADENHPERVRLEETFVNRVREVVERGGTVLIPAFSVGRSQEVLCILAAHKFEHPVAVDGMALEVNEVMLRHPSCFRDYELLRTALENATWVNRWRDRKDMVHKPGVIVSPAGMLKGGAAAFYVEKVAEQSRNAIFLVSYQIPGTPGRVLLEEGKVFVHGKPRKVQAEVERFDFSSHAGGGELKMLLKSIRSNPTVYVVHGNGERCLKLAEWIRTELGFNSVAPAVGEVYKI